MNIGGKSYNVVEARSDGSMKVSTGSVFDTFFGGGVDTRIVERDGSVRDPGLWD